MALFKFKQNKGKDGDKLVNTNEIFFKGYSYEMRIS